MSGSPESLADELFEFCESDSLSEAGLREITERWYKVTSDHTLLDLSRYEFFYSACGNKLVTLEVIKYLLECFPGAANSIDDEGWTPLHSVCYNNNVTIDIIQLLIDAAPDSVRSVDNDGLMPLHNFCIKYVDENPAMEILKLMLKKCPESVRHAANGGYLPLHYAAGRKSPEFCRVLIETYPGSERISTNKGSLPLHLACIDNSHATVEYLYKLYTDAIKQTSTDGQYPIHYAIRGLKHNESPIVVVDSVRFLLDCNPDVKLQKLRGRSLLRKACRKEYNDSNIDAALQVIKVIYDAHPKAIEKERLVTNIHRYHQQVQAFINGELVYARQANNHRQMTTPDENGQLPLHRALQNIVRLGSIKLLVSGNPTATQTFDNNAALPLHVACQYHDSSRVIQYLIDVDPTTLDAVDRDGNTALHYACRRAKFDMITMLLDKYDAVSVSKLNTNKKLPIDLLWESDEVEDRRSIEYLDCVFRLLRAYPETLQNIDLDIKIQAKSKSSPSPNAKAKKQKLI